MKKCSMTLLVILFVGFASLFVHTNVSHASDACFIVTDSQWGKSCDGDPNSLELTIKNTCDKKMALLSCMDHTDSKKSCSVRGDIEGGANVKIFTCNANGNYKLIGCERTYDCKQAMKSGQI